MTTKHTDSYKVATIRHGEDIDADAVIVNAQGAWLAEIDYISTGPDIHTICAQYITIDGDYIPAPENWRSSIIFEI